MLAADAPPKELVSADVGAHGAVAIDALKKGSCVLLEELLDAGPAVAPELLCETLALIAPAESVEVSPGVSRETFRILQSKLRSLSPEAPFLIIKHIFEQLQRNVQVSVYCIEFFPSLFNAILAQKTISWKHTHGQHKSFQSDLIVSLLLERLLALPISPANILPTILTLRELPVDPSEAACKALLRRLEDVPERSLPAALYQCLLWPSKSSLFSLVFETLFALMDARGEDCSCRSECLAHIKLALAHNMICQKEFLKHAKKHLTLTHSPSPFLFLLLTSIGSSSTESLILIENYLLQQAVTSVTLRAAGLADNLAGVGVSDIERLFEKTITALQSDDEATFLALTGLGKRLIALRNPNSYVQDAVHLMGNRVLYLLAQNFECTRIEVLKFLIDKTLLLGCVVIKTELRIGMEILLSEISAIDRGQSLYYLLKKQPEILPSLLEICAKDQKNFEMCALLLLHKDSQISSRRSLAVDLACNSYTVATTVLSCRPCFFLQVITFHLLHNQDAELWIYVLLDKCLSAPGAKVSCYGKLVAFVRAAPSFAVDIFALLYRKFNLLCDKDDITDWNLILSRCIDREKGKVVEPLPALLSALNYVSKMAQTEDAHRFSGSLNHLCELLCHQTEWLGPEDTFPVREQTKSLLAELYDVGLVHCSGYEEFTDRAKFEGCEKISVKKAELCADNASLFAGKIPVITLEDARRILELAISSCSTLRLAVIFNHVLRSQWSNVLGDAGELIATLLKVFDWARSTKAWLPSDLLRACIQKILTLSKDALDQSRQLGHLCWMVGADVPVEILTPMANLIGIVNSTVKSTDGKDFLESYLEICKTQASYSQDPKAAFVRSFFPLVWRHPCLSEAPALAGQICSDIAAVLGPINGESSVYAEGGETSLKIISKDSVNCMAASAIRFLVCRMHEMAWLCSLATRFAKDCANYASVIMNRVFENLSWIVECCSPLAKALLAGSSFRSFLKALQLLFRTSNACCKLLSASRSPVPQKFVSVMERLTGGLTCDIYAMLPVAQQADLEQTRDKLQFKKKKKKGKPETPRSRAQKTKESQLVPGLIFQIEIFERSILALNAVHNVKFVKKFYRSTARDFRIQAHELDSALGALRDGAETGTGNDCDNPTGRGDESLDADTQAVGAAAAEEPTSEKAYTGAEMSLVISNGDTNQ